MIRRGCNITSAILLIIENDIPSGPAAVLAHLLIAFIMSILVQLNSVPSDDGNMIVHALAAELAVGLKFLSELSV